MREDYYMAGIFSLQIITIFFKIHTQEVIFFEEILTFVGMFNSFFFYKKDVAFQDCLLSSENQKLLKTF